MRYEPAAVLAPGAVCRDAVVGWISPPLHFLRPRTGLLEGRTLTAEAAAFPPPFVEGVDEVMATVKRRPVLIVASRPEIQIARTLRVVPIHRKGDKGFYTRRWTEIVAGEVAGLIAMPDGRPNYEFDEGVLDLTATQRIDRALMPTTPWFRLDDASLVGIVAAMERLLESALTGRRP